MENSVLFLGQQKSEHRILTSADPRVPFGPVGQCIYCENETDPAKLTLEHIIPSGIAGNLEFEKSSCYPCAAVTGRTEQFCLRQMFDTPRAMHGLRKRKHKDASQTAKYRFIEGGVNNGKMDESTGVEREMEFSKGPPNMIPNLITHYLPSILLGLPTTVKIPSYFYGNLDIHSMQSAHAKEGGHPGIDEVGVGFKLHAGRLGQMIAKIAHSYAVSQLGLDGFTPFLQGYIREREDQSFDSHHIGSMIWGVDHCIHNIGLYLFPLDSPPGVTFHRSMFWVVRLHLFAWRNPLAYFIAVGRPK
jgi:hypothetical protein